MAEQLERIASFSVDHDKLAVGMYLSRTDGDVITYDLRMTKPNCGEYLSNPALHTIEHLFATYARNSRWKDGVIYVGPMGCRTGFYLLLRDTVSRADAIRLALESMRFIASFAGEIPGASPVECGNAAEHSLPAAQKAVAPMIPLLESWTVERLQYA